MKITKEIYDLADFDAWSEAVSAKEKIVEAGKGEAFMSELEALYPEGIDEGNLNDLLWFDEEFCFELVGLDKDGNEPSDDDGEDEDEDEEEEGEGEAQRP